MKKEEPKPVKVYEEKKAYNFKPKGKKGLENYVPFSICDIKEECHDIRIHGKIFEIEIAHFVQEKIFRLYGLRMMMTLSS